MVCKECGAYNAEHLTHCRVCAARLKDSDGASAEETVQEAPARPARNFAKAPQWPTRAYEGAADADTIKPEISSEEKSKTETQAAKPAAPAAKPAAVAAQPAAAKPKAAQNAASGDAPKFCPSCGKALVEGAQFCAFCGSRAIADARGASGIATAAAVSKQVTARPETDDEIEEIHTHATKPMKKAAPMHASKKKALAPVDDEDDDLDLDEYGDEDFDDDDEDDDFEEDDDYYDDEFDDDDLPKKKGKGSAVVFWILIVVLIALIVGFGMYYANKKYGGVSQMFSALSGGSNVETPVEGTDDPSAGMVPADTSMEPSATIEESTGADGSTIYLINVSAPTGSQVKILTETTLQNDTATITGGDMIKLQVPQEVFLPNDYCETPTITVTPQLEIISPDGASKTLNVPAVTITVPTVSLTITKPEGLTAEATADGSPITIEGTMDDHTVEVTVNGEAANVWAGETGGGLFSFEYKPTSEENQTVEVVAKKKNCMSSTQTIAVTPYVVKDMTLTVTSALTALTAVDGKVTVEGTAVPGATVAATCDNTDIVCGAVTVSDTGAFSCAIEVPKEGCYTIKFTGTGDGYTEGLASCIVERMPTTKSSTYKTKATNVAKNYEKLSAGTSTATQLVATGKITEIVSTAPYTIFKLELSDGNVVMVYNRSAKNKIEADDVGATKTIAGFNAGVYPETTCPTIWGWFIWNK